MFIPGTKTGVRIWFALWGRQETGFNMSAYKSAMGLRKWALADEWKDVPLVRLGIVEAIQGGWQETATWSSREAFLDWYKIPTIPF